MKHIVNIADMKVTDCKDDILITYALGSCLGITVYDPVAQIGGLFHVMLPLSAINKEKAKKNPFMFVDTGLPLFLDEIYKLGGDKNRLEIKVAGGASRNGYSENDHFQIGKRNFIMLRKVLWENNLMLQACEIGGVEARAMILKMNTGDVELKINGTVKTL